MKDKLKSREMVFFPPIPLPPAAGQGNDEPMQPCDFAERAKREGNSPPAGQPAAPEPDSAALRERILTKPDTELPGWRSDILQAERRRIAGMIDDAREAAGQRAASQQGGDERKG